MQQRKHVIVNDIVHIGKESNDLDNSEILGLNSDSYVTYENRQILDRKFKELSPRILKLQPKDVKKVGISRQTLWNVKKLIKTSHVNIISNKIKMRLIKFLIN